jgi:hypothetical protein
MRLTAKAVRFIGQCAYGRDSGGFAHLSREECEAIPATLRVISTMALGRQHVRLMLPGYLVAQLELMLDSRPWDSFADLVAETFDVPIRGSIPPETSISPGCSRW